MAGVDIDRVKDRLVAEVDRRADVLVSASHEIHAHPELCFEERFAHDLLTDTIEADGLEVERHAYGIETAFAARAGGDGPVVAVLCEYDALPGIGHGCGHNVIAAAGLGAGLALAAMADELGGRVLLLGTPAEEGGGGKVRLAEQGAFDGVDAAMMVHSAGRDLTRMHAIAIHRLEARYEGEAAHAAAAPHKGRNALDAMVLGYVNIAALRQHIRDDERVHGIFLESGDQANIVPARTRAEWYVRSPRQPSLERLKARVLACLEAGAAAAACQLHARWIDPVYLEMRDNGPLVDAYVANAGRIGRDVVDPDVAGAAVVGSTDMGNVSHLVPSIHPMIQVSPPHVAIHTPEFAEWAIAPEGDRAALDGAKVLAMTGADLWLRDDLRAAVSDSFRAATSRS